jgi:hypothetical protein
MDYSFNGKVAEIYGVAEAVFIHNLYWWIAKNEANGRHYYDGRNWTYNSMEAFTKLFPFWTIKQVRRIINKLYADGAIHIGNYNQRGFDRTQWYALDETVTALYQTGESICPNGQMEVPKQANGSAQMGRPIPDSKPDINTDSKPDKSVRFAPPTLEEVKAYCLERGNNVNPSKWFDHYTANGWKVGKVKMTDWKAAVRTWEDEKPRKSKFDALRAAAERYAKEDGIG